MFPFFNNYPGTDLHEIDLAYILKLCAELRASNTTLTAWKAQHEAEYIELTDKVDGLINNLVDVISPWDSSIAYHIFSIVEYQGTNYIAIQDVPVGAMITNTEYWQPANTVVEQINAMGLVVSDVQDKTSYYVMPQEYGAVADGVTDDTAAVRACILDALDKNATIRLQGWYKVDKIDLSGVAERFYDLKMIGNTPNTSSTGYYEQSEGGTGFVSSSSDYVFVFPILHNAVFKDFGFRIVNGCYAFKFVGGLEVQIDNINFGYHGGMCEILSGSYWHFTSCAINTDDENIVYINTTTSITQAEYFYFEDCVFAHDKTNYSGSAIKTNGNNFTSFNHCDFIGLDSCIDIVGAFTGKALKIIDCQLGTNHIITNNQTGSNIGINGIYIIACNIHVNNEYILAVSDAINIQTFVFIGNIIYTVPTLTTKTALAYTTITHHGWRIGYNAVQGGAVIPPFTNMRLASAAIDGRYESSRYVHTSQAAASLASGISYTETLEYLPANGSGVFVEAYAISVNGKVASALTVSDMSITDASITLTVTGTGLSGLQNVVIVVNYL